MRIVGGRLRGRRLAAPSSAAVRPTGDRLRESLFNILAHAYGDPVSGARVLDLFAGTGALGLEALSLGLGGAARIFRRDATGLGPAHPLAPFSLVFLDPPYGNGLAERALASARDGGWLAPDALIVVEEATQAAFKPPEEGFQELERRRYDDTELVFLRASGL